MTTLYKLHRHRDISTVSGTGAVATICEFSSGLVAMHWDSPTPSVAVYTDIRHIEALHGHKGASTLERYESDRLLAGYQRVTPYLLSGHRNPDVIGPHRDHPDRLLLAFKEEATWRFWVGLLDGSTYAATYEQVDGQIVGTWVTPDGNVWCQWVRRGAYEDLLDGETYDEPSKYEYIHDDIHDPRD